MEIGITAYTGDYPYMEKLHCVNRDFDTRYFKTLRTKKYGGTITDCIIVPISIFEEEGEDLKFHKKKYIERYKNWDGDWKSSIIFNLFINPSIVQKSEVDDIHQLYCDLIIEQLNDPNFKLPKNFNSTEFKQDFRNIVENFRQQKIPNDD